MVAALLPALYWLHRRWPIGERYNLAIHVAAVVPFSILHTSGMAALRLLWFSGIIGVPYSFPLTVDRLQYEFAKDLVTYLMLTTGVVALNYLLQRKAAEPVADRRLRRTPVACRSNASPCASAAAARSWSRWPTSTGSRPPATTRSFMSAPRLSRSVHRLRSSRASSMRSDSFAFTSHTL